MIKHINCRNAIYPKSKVCRFNVPDEFVNWSILYPEYNPPEYTAPHIKGQSWADADIVENNDTFKPKWNHLDGNINRISYITTYNVCDKFPLNPMGRTGIRGRGLLGRWGPNHAADPVVTRWKRDIDGKKVSNAQQNKGILQMVTIQRHDNGMWAIPGGMVDAGESVSETLKREFTEEALNNFPNGEEMLKEFFAQGVDIYKGYVDDFRNTDNAWIETVACNFHDHTGDTVGKLSLIAGDDAAHVRWIDLNKEIKLHANHIDIISKIVKRLNAYW